MLLRKCFCLLSASGWDNQAPSRSASAAACLSPDPNRLFLRSGNLSFPAAELRGCAGRSLTMPCAMAIMFSVSAKNNLSDASSHRAIPLAQKHHAAASRSSFSTARSFYSFGASISPVYSKRPYFSFPGSQVCPFCCYISPCGWAQAMLRIQEESQLADSWFRAPVTPQPNFYFQLGHHFCCPIPFSLGLWSLPAFPLSPFWQQNKAHGCGAGRAPSPPSEATSEMVVFYFAANRFGNLPPLLSEDT